MRNKELSAIEEAVVIKKALEELGVNPSHITNSEFFRIVRGVKTVIDGVIEEGAVAFEGRDMLGETV